MLYVDENTREQKGIGGTNSSSCDVVCSSFNGEACTLQRYTEVVFQKSLDARLEIAGRIVRAWSFKVPAAAASFLGHSRKATASAVGSPRSEAALQIGEPSRC
jgi:hypothetical protein